MKRVSTTQLMATPTLKGKDAERLLESLKIKPTAESIKNGKELVEFFEKFKKGVKYMNKYEKTFNEISQEEMKSLNMLVEDGEVSNLGLDPNNWDHVGWWYDNEDAETFMRNNREKIESYAKTNNINLFETIEILMQEEL